MEVKLGPYKKRKRSPSYPAIGLQVAVEKARVLYNEDGQSGSSKEAAYSYWGYSGAHGRSLTLTATLKKYGLTTEEKESIFLTKDAILILLEGGDEKQRLDAIRRCALQPYLYVELWDRYKRSGLPSDATLKTVFVNEYEFNKNKVDEAIRAFRETVDFARLKETTADEDIDKNKDRQRDMGTLLEAPKTFLDQKDKDTPTKAFMRDYAIPRKMKKVAILRLEYPVTKADIEQIRKWLDLMADSISDEDELEQTE